MRFSRTRSLWLAWLLQTLALGCFAGAGEQLLVNPGFETNGGWANFWSRDTNAGQAQADTNAPHSGKRSLRIEHRGEKDWCVNAEPRLAVQPGAIYELAGWVRAEGQGDVTLCVALYDAENKPLEWAWGTVAVEPGPGWQNLQTRFAIPPDARWMLPRWIGYGPVTAWLDDTHLRALEPPRTSMASMPRQITLSNASLTVTFNTVQGTLDVLDGRTGGRWSQRAVAPNITVRNVRKNEPDSLTADLFHIGSGLEIQALFKLDPALPELSCTLTATGRLTGPLRYPYPFITAPGTYLVIPMNEGISYPVEDSSIQPMRLVAYGGHGICMAFWGVTDGRSGHMAIFETPDDAAILMGRNDDRLFVSPEWDPQKRAFGYTRKLRYVFFDQGGHVAIAKRYRAHAQSTDLLKTLADKRKSNPNVDLLIGAANIWCWEKDALPFVREMRALGIQHILWSNRQQPDSLRALNELGVLTSRYDIYQDVMNPDNFKFLRGVHGDWVTPAWPNDIIYNMRDDWIKGWEVKGTNGQWYPCGVICDKRAPHYAQERIPAELKRHPYGSRFIDTTTAAPWHECYHTNHPMTRTESRRWKMELLRYVSEDCKLVTGCETGHDASVPYLHYFEGMLSLGPYRVPDSGRDMLRIWDEVPERVAKFQLGHRYRLPLWELVFHDCVVAQWYWGDYNNKLPALWDKRDLFNLLYGTPPMFMFNRKIWEQNKDRFARSYQTICPTVRKVGYSEMTDHRFLTPNRDVQQTRFANGTTVTVNFGDNSFTMPTGQLIAPNASLVQN